MIEQILTSFISDWSTGIYLLVFIIILAQTGLLIFFFLPGNPVLFTLGALTSVSNLKLSFSLLFFTSVLAGLAGNILGFWFGEKYGLKFSSTARLKLIENYFQKYGTRTIIFAPFLGNVRTLTPFFSGMSKISKSQFRLFSLIAMILWVGTILTIGALFGDIPSVKQNLHLITLAFIVIALLPTIVRTVYLKLT